MDELKMKGITTPESLFSHRHKGKSSPPSQILITNGKSSPTELIMKPTDYKHTLSVSSPMGPDSPISQTTPPLRHLGQEYSKPSHIPTPFTIKDILGLGDEEGGSMDAELITTRDCEQEEEEEEPMELCIRSSTPEPNITASQEENQQLLCMELDEPLNLTVVKRESPESPSSCEETNNNRLVNGGRRFMGNNHFNSARNKSPTGPLLPNDVIIPKVKRPKTATAVALKNGGKSKGCGAINLKTGTKRKTKDPGGSSSPKIRSNPLAISLAVDTTGGIVNTPTPHHTSSSMLSPGLENGSSNDSKKRKKARTTFTGKQIYELERQFEIKKYLSSSERSEMARLLNVTEVQVKIWFQNRRTKWKKQENVSNAEAAEHKVMATKGPGSKKDKNKGSSSLSKKISTSSTTSSVAGGDVGRIPGTSECSLSISASMDSSEDDHDNSNPSLISDDGHNVSEGGRKILPTPEDFSLLQQKLFQSHTPSSANSVLLSHLSRSPSSLALESPEGPGSDVSPIRGRSRSPLITIPRLILSSTLLGLSVPIPLKSSDSNDKVPTPPPPQNNGESTPPPPPPEEIQEEQDISNMMPIEKIPPPPSNLVVSVIGGDTRDDIDTQPHNHTDDEDEEENLLSMNKDLNNDTNSNQAPFSPVSQAS